MVKKLAYLLERGFLVVTLVCIILLLVIQIFTQSHETSSVYYQQEENESMTWEIIFQAADKKSSKLMVLVNGENAGNFITGKCKVNVANGDVLEIMGLKEKYTVKVIEKDSKIQNNIENQVYEIENEIKYVGKMIITN